MERKFPMSWRNGYNGVRLVRHCSKLCFADYLKRSFQDLERQMKRGEISRKTEIKQRYDLPLKTGRDSYSCWGNDKQWQFLHASTSSGVMISGTYREERYWGGCAIWTTDRILLIFIEWFFFSVTLTINLDLSLNGYEKKRIAKQKVLFYTDYLQSFFWPY